MNSHLLSALSTINHAGRHSRLFVDIQATTLTRRLITLLLTSSLIRNAESREIGYLRLHLRYYRGRPVITAIHIHSTPGRRLHVPVRKIDETMRRVRSRYIFLSTPQHGIISGEEALVLRTGGELLFSVR